MATLFDAQMLERSLRDQDVDTKKMPLGRLEIGAIRRGQQVLADLESFLTSQEESAAVSGPLRLRLQELSAAFYSAIPHVVDRRSALPLLSSTQSLAEKRDLLVNLESLLVAATQLKASAASA